MAAFLDHPKSSSKHLERSLSYGNLDPMLRKTLIKLLDATQPIDLSKKRRLRKGLGNGQTAVISQRKEGSLFLTYGGNR